MCLYLRVCVCVCVRAHLSVCVCVFLEVSERESVKGVTAIYTELIHMCKIENKKC